MSSSGTGSGGGSGGGTSGGSGSGDITKPPRPNILLITCDQYRFPRFSYGKLGGFHPHLKEILGFQEISAHNQFVKFFPGLMKLRNHTGIATYARYLGPSEMTALAAATTSSDVW